MEIEHIPSETQSDSMTLHKLLSLPLLFKIQEDFPSVLSIQIPVMKNNDCLCT